MLDQCFSAGGEGASLPPCIGLKTLLSLCGPMAMFGRTLPSGRWGAAVGDFSLKGVWAGDGG